MWLPVADSMAVTATTRAIIWARARAGLAVSMAVVIAAAPAYPPHPAGAGVSRLRVVWARVWPC